MLNHSATSHDEDINDQRWMLTRKQQLSHFCNANENQTKFDKLLALMSLEVLPLQHVGVDGEVGSPYEEEIQTHLGWDDPYTLESSIGKDGWLCCQSFHNIDCNTIQHNSTSDMIMQYNATYSVKMKQELLHDILNQNSNTITILYGLR